MRTAIAIAAGGGGDAVTAAMIASAMPELGIAAIMSYSWDRFMIDPTPGPRIRTDFVGLVDRGGVAEVRRTAALRHGTSTLPRLSDCVAQPLLLLEAAGGAKGMADLMRCAAAAFDADELIVVDVGGDIVAEGHESGLRSPLADSLALAAAVRSGIPTRVLIAGPGLDGELSSTEVHARIDTLGGRQVANLTSADAMPFEAVWSWHPSEATALLAAAALGWRGVVETQRDAIVNLTDASTRVYEVNAQGLMNSSLAVPLSSTNSLDQAEQTLRDRRGGRSELDVERHRAAGERAEVRMPTLESLSTIDQYADRAQGRGIDALTLRRVAEMLQAIDPSTTAALRALLAKQRPDNFRPPLYQVAR
ncbi:DUF1152 domain-containing protein [Nocardia seriolae]|uniref:DUF1152 domain-containing protein n=2 Tax=Nocardia seriolae TaxID=37332 RepID=A0ABC8AT28_9NOCA|nr:DUF1152 domain-containing protein [Nocardia seriolae]APA97337.1 hypothetical protein NS506_03284 [Nocardia seriolae]PSK32782.1 DUF1152 domain-containing protein [Nocardia seriolae]QOW34320.1 DUF1152 domain-containing protein [Nocardia seriolae]QUN18223.1 DUF1152 domain-containing protein [Nocardia seriolae]WNJ61503.1 DUF1152 domain-containing protein [Nocardia seriolae]